MKQVVPGASYEMLEVRGLKMGVIVVFCGVCRLGGRGDIGIIRSELQHMFSTLFPSVLSPKMWAYFSMG